MDEIKPEAALPHGEEGKPIEQPVPVQDEREPPVVTETSNTEPANLSATLQIFTDKALHFLSHASNETLGACLVGLGATTYLILGRVGLVIIGVASGVVLHATWEGIRGDDEVTKKAEQERKRETGLEVARRVLDLRLGAKDSTSENGDVKVYANQDLDFSGFEPETAVALNVVADAIIKDYVHYWYDPTIPGEDTFPAASKRTLTAFILSLSGHLQRKRAADAFLDFVTNATSIIIVFLNELSAALNASPNSSAEDAVAAYLQMKPDSSLAHVLDTKHQDTKLRLVAEDIMESYLDPKAYNCPPVHAFLKQVLAQLVLGYSVSMISKPDWINEWIVYGLEESETTSKVMDIVDAGVGGRASMESQKSNGSSAVAQEVRNSKDITPESNRPAQQQQRKVEEEVDDAMEEARRLTQMMIEEDERRAREEQERQAVASSTESISDAATTQGLQTPTSSDSDRDRQDAETSAWGGDTPEEPEMSKQDERPSTPTTKQFTSFDQILPTQQPTALSGSPGKARPEAQQLTLHNANIMIFDDSVPGERTSIKAKPVDDYFLQIEPASSAFPGWMITRKYADFELLHEVLRRISVITGVGGFNDSHPELPKWRVHTKASLREELERYLCDAVRYQPLAESEGMRRFLEKDQGLTKSPGERTKGFGWPTPEVFGKFGGDMMNVLTKAPKDVAGGGKALFGGVAGLVGGKRNSSQANLSRTGTSNTPSHQSKLSVSQPYLADSYPGSPSAARPSQESIRSVPVASRDRTGSTATTASMDLRPKPMASPQRPSSETSRPTSIAPQVSPTASQVQLSPVAGVEETFNLPPPPSEISDNYGAPSRPVRQSVETNRSSTLDPRNSTSSDAEKAPPTPARVKPTPTKAHQPKPPITEQETSVAVELMFAVITELYTLSSAWQIRRTLLTAAKTYLLRPGNPQLTTIRDMLQQSLLDNNLSDPGIAGHLYKLRENALPTAEEMEVWKRDYPEKTPEQKEALRIKARALLVQKGMPQALTSVMGAAASGEALGKVFDCLQVEAVSRGLMFGLVLQGLKVVTH